MVWPVAGTAHLSKRVKFGTLLNVTSSVLFTTLQHLFRFRYGSFGLLLRCFGGALDFFHVYNTLTFSSGVFALGDCPLIALR